MLASISPLGERARSSRWLRTATAYLVGSLIGGLLVGLVAARLGSLLPHAWRGSPGATGLVAVLLATGLALDRRVGGLRLPSWQRQVDQRWLGRYRGWVLGLGFGVQLGTGVVTIVTSSTVYAVVLLSAWSGTAAAGLAIGGVFGVVRALPVAGLARVDHPGDLHRIFGRLDHWGPWANWLAQASLALGSLSLVTLVTVAVLGG